MEIKEYRIIHSEIIEQYQLIEFHLEGLFAIMLESDNNFLELAHRVENDAMGELIRKVRFLVKEYKYQDILTKDDFKILDQIRDDRNYYCHENFLNNKTKKYKNKKDTSIKEDLKVVTYMNERLKTAFEKIRKNK